MVSFSIAVTPVEGGALGASMKPFIMRAAVAAGLLSFVAFAGSASAKTDDKAKAADSPHPRYAHSYAEALAEAKERGCVIFATLHEDG